MNVCRIDPLKDPRWSAFVSTHPDAAVFHTKPWLEALQRTYRYQPLGYAIEDGERLISGIPFCRVNSFITGNRLVSLPFSDHCQPLIESPDHFSHLMAAAEDDAGRSHLKYVEVRPLVSPDAEFAASQRVVVHKLDISRNEDQLLKHFHPDCIRRKIAKAEREHLQHEEGRSEDLLRKFYPLLLMTRRRLGIPPQPLRWFRNLLNCFDDSLKICIASKDETPIAGILTISFKKTIIYKYGCSDPKYNALAGSIFLLWRAIQGARQLGLTEMDFGRSDYSTPGLITFKDRWGAVQIPVTYYRSGAASATRGGESRLLPAGKRLLATVPDSMFRALGGLLYRHVG